MRHRLVMRVHEEKAAPDPEQFAPQSIMARAMPGGRKFELHTSNESGVVDVPSWYVHNTPEPIAEPTVSAEPIRMRMPTLSDVFLVGIIIAVLVWIFVLR